MDPSVNYSLMIQERGKYPAFPFKLFFQLIGPKHAIALLVAWTGVCVWVWGGGGVLGLMFAGYVPLSFHSPYPIIVYFFFQLQTPAQSLFGKCNFRDPNLVTFYLCIYLINVVSRTECNAVSASLLLNLMKNNFLIFF